MFIRSTPYYDSDKLSSCPLVLFITTDGRPATWMVSNIRRQKCHCAASFIATPSLTGPRYLP